MNVNYETKRINKPHRTNFLFHLHFHFTKYRKFPVYSNSSSCIRELELGNSTNSIGNNSN